MENQGVSKTQVKVCRPASAKNRLMLMDATPNLNDLLKKVKPVTVPQEKEKLYEEINKLRLLVNSYKDEVSKHKGRIRQHLQDLNKRDELIMELTAKLDKPGYKNIHVISELSRRLRLTEMQLEEALTDLNNPHNIKSSKKFQEILNENEERLKNLLKENADKEEYIKSLTEKIAHLIEEKKNLSDANAELQAKIKDLEKTLKGMVNRTEFNSRVGELEKELKEKIKDLEDLEGKWGKDKDVIKELRKRIAEFEELNKKMIGQAEKFKNEVESLRAELDRYRKSEVERENRRLRVMVCKGDFTFCAGVKFVFGLPGHFRHFLYCLQLERIYPEELRKKVFGGIDELVKVNFLKLSQFFSGHLFKFVKNKSLLDQLVKDLMGNEKEVSVKDVLGKVEKVLGKWMVYEKSDQDKLELELLRLISVKYQEILDECLKYDKTNQGIINIYEFFTSLTLTGSFLHSYIIGYTCLLFYSISNEIDKVPYKDFLSGFLSNLSRLDKDDLEFISKSYMQKIAKNAIKFEKRVSKEFHSKKGKIFNSEFKSGCSTLSIVIVNPIAEVLLKFYGHEKKGEFFIKKKKFLEELKKFGYEEKDFSCSSSSSSSRKSKKVEEVKNEVVGGEDVIVRNVGMFEKDVKKIFKNKSSSCSWDSSKESSDTSKKSSESSKKSSESSKKSSKSSKKSSKSSKKSSKSSKKSSVKIEKNLVIRGKSSDKSIEEKYSSDSSVSDENEKIKSSKKSSDSSSSKSKSSELPAKKEKSHESSKKSGKSSESSKSSKKSEKKSPESMKSSIKQEKKSSSSSHSSIKLKTSSPKSSKSSKKSQNPFLTNHIPTESSKESESSSSNSHKSSSKSSKSSKKSQKHPSISNIPPENPKKSDSSSSKSHKSSSKSSSSKHSSKDKKIQPIPLDKIFKDEKFPENPKSTRYHQEENKGFDKTQTVFTVTQFQTLNKEKSEKSKSSKKSDSPKSSDKSYHSSFTSSSHKTSEKKSVSSKSSGKEKSSESGIKNSFPKLVSDQKDKMATSSVSSDSENQKSPDNKDKNIEKNSEKIQKISEISDSESSMSSDSDSSGSSDSSSDTDSESENSKDLSGSLSATSSQNSKTSFSASGSSESSSYSSSSESNRKKKKK